MNILSAKKCFTQKGPTNSKIIWKYPFGILQIQYSWAFPDTAEAGSIDFRRRVHTTNAGDGMIENI